MFGYNLPTATGKDERTVFSEKGNTFTQSEESVPDPAGMIPDNIKIGIFVGRHQRIRCFHGIIGVTELPAGPVNIRRKPCIHPLHGIIEQMHSPVGHQPACIIPEEAEVIMKTILIEIAFGCRAEPHVIIHTGGNSRIRDNRQCPLTGLISPHLYGSHAPQCATLHIGRSFIPVRVATLPLAHLHDPVIFPCSPDHEVTLFDGIGQRFFHIYVLSCLTGGNHLQTVPMVGSTNDHHVHILVVDDPSPVLHQLCGFITFEFLIFCRALVEPLIVHIAERDTFHCRILQKSFEIAPSLIPTTYQAYFNFVAWCRLTIQGGKGFSH